MLPNWYLNYKERIENNIKIFLDDYFKDNKNETINNFSETIYYSIRWGKRIRSVFALEFYLNLSNKNFEDIKDDDDIWKICFAIECLHWYSLVHDDLPAMDNDDYRRWELTTWKKYWETDWILSWDWMQALAFEAIWMMKNEKAWFKLIKLFANSVGSFGMVWGQVLDLFYEKNPNEVNINKLIETHNKKTWALITFSIISWVILSWYEWDLTKFYNFWKEIWLAFQVKDDLLDVEWTFEETGKSVWWEKKWFVHLIWLEESKKYLNDLINNCQNNIKDLNDEKLEFLVKYIWTRTK